MRHKAWDRVFAWCVRRWCACACVRVCYVHACMHACVVAGGWVGGRAWRACTSYAARCKPAAGSKAVPPTLIPPHPRAPPPRQQVAFRPCLNTASAYLCSRRRAAAHADGACHLQSAECRTCGRRRRRRREGQGRRSPSPLARLQVCHVMSCHGMQAGMPTKPAPIAAPGRAAVGRHMPLPSSRLRYIRPAAWAAAPPSLGPRRC